MSKTNPYSKLGVLKTKRPKFRNHRGRTWDNCYVILPDGEKIEGHLDTTWGIYAYFEKDGQWFKFCMHHYTDIAPGNDYTCFFDINTYESEEMYYERLRKEKTYEDDISLFT